MVAVAAGWNAAGWWGEHLGMGIAPMHLRPCIQVHVFLRFWFCPCQPWLPFRFMSSLPVATIDIWTNVKDVNVPKNLCKAVR